MTRSDTRIPARRPARALSSTVEREIKLAVGPDFRLPPIPGLPLPPRLLTSVYYDTAAHDLAHARITLRRRIERGKQAWQLKIPLNNDRQEVELVDRQTQPPAAFRELLLLHLGPRKLAPVATLRVSRTGLRVLRRRRPAAEIVLDRVSVMKDHRAIRRFREVEVEQLGADDGVLKEIEYLLHRAGAGEHDGRPKLFHALSLPAPSPDPPPARDAPVAAHIRWALAQHVCWLLAHDPGTRLGTECESLHQMRVATRRLRAVLRAARPVLVPDWAGSLQSELSWLGRLLGPARDLDVQIEYFTKEAEGLDARDRKPLAQFVAHLQGRREHAQQVLLGELRSARYLELIRRLKHAVRDPAVLESPVTLHELARGAFKKLRKAIRRLSPSPSHVALHRLRIKTKRARYAAELAVWSTGKPAVRFMKQAETVQDLLGINQDALQAETYIRRFLKQSTGVRAAFVAGRMVERQRQRRDQVRKSMTGPLKNLLKQGRKAWD
ncbi:CHAD domain-containing protein [Nitrospira sp. NS4]|uniref:CYTH and CHAD domain-containing protein n=1 Tax=Nitrospira sp. NS4 TaxID=3414498 RepID=UPI003C2E08D1